MKKLMMLLLLGSTPAIAQDATKNLIGNLSSTADYSIFVNALNLSGVSQTLRSGGPYTVLAPNDFSYYKLAAGSLDKLLKAENRDLLTKVMSYHIIPGKYTVANIREAISNGNGKATLKTIGGSTLLATQIEGGILLTDENGNSAKIVVPDQVAENGIFHGVDTVIAPKTSL